MAILLRQPTLSIAPLAFIQVVGDYFCQIDGQRAARELFRLGQKRLRRREAGQEQFDVGEW